MRKNAVVLGILILGLVSTATQARAGVRTLAGLWVATTDNTSYWLKLEATSADPARLIEELSGTMRVGSMEGSSVTTKEVPVTGQYLTRTGIAVLNIGEPGVKRSYAIGDTRAEHTKQLDVKIFSVRPAHGIYFERELSLGFKSQSHPQAD